MASCEPDEEVEFSLDIKTLDLIESEVPWTIIRDEEEVTTTFEATAQMKGICYGATEKKVADDGEHRVPFWGGDALQQVVIDSGRTKGWLKLVYKRSTTVKNNKKGEETEYNTAHFAVRSS